jgi:hypothetical protein
VTGRNEQCPCGSGKKYKVCCLGKVLDFPSPVQQKTSLIPGSIFDVDDPKLNQIKSDLRDLYHLEKKNAGFLDEISIELGLLGYTKDAINYAKRALKFCSANNSTLRHSILVNLAAMHSQIDQHAVGLEYLKKVPDGSSRKSVIEANIRIHLQPFDEVIHLYEQAIAEEPDFFLPYEHIISRLEYSDPKREYLIEKALKNMPSNPRALFYWADAELLKRNYERLADDVWIENVKSFDLESSPDHATLKFSDRLPYILGGLELIHEASRLMIFAASNVGYDSVLKFSSIKNKRTESNISFLIETYLPDVEDSFRCNVAKNMIDVAITYGKKEDIETSIVNLCASCAEEMKLDQLRFSCLYRRIKQNKTNGTPVENSEVQEIIKLADQVLEDSDELTEDFANSLFDFLDEEVSSEAALEYAVRLLDEQNKRIAFTNSYEKMRLFWNLAIIAGKTSSWSLSESFFENVQGIDLIELISEIDQNNCEGSARFKSDDEKTIRENLFLFNLMLIIPKLGQKKLEESREALNGFIKKLKDDTKFGPAIDEINNIISWVENHQDSATYKNDFRRALEKFNLNYWIGSKPKLDKSVNSISALFELSKKQDVSSKIKFHKTLNYQEAMASEDLSAIVNVLEELIPNFRVLPENARTSLITAELYRNSARSNFDSAPAIMGYCKSLEIFLKDIVFSNFARALQSSDNYETEINEAKEHPKFSQFRSLISFLDFGYLELGSATQCLKLCHGTTAEKVTVLKNLQLHIKKFHHYLSSLEVIMTIENLSKKYRNPAVHEKVFDADDLEKVRHTIGIIFNELLTIKEVKVA